MVLEFCFASSPLTAKAAFFGSVPLQAEFKKSEANFLKEAKTAALQLRSPAGCGGENNKAKRANNCNLFIPALPTL